MARVRCTVEEVLVPTRESADVVDPFAGLGLEGFADHALEMPGVAACCGRCGHVETAVGTSEASVKRALVKLYDYCPRGEENFYLADE
jgi:hypothetical protein